ncbi:MAG: hypothetical protein LC792_19035, partial [Actinobacteria bacterium]|nr:hypothetical protein [Actinomycetota bacterium]
MRRFISLLAASLSIASLASPSHGAVARAVGSCEPGWHSVPRPAPLLTDIAALSATDVWVVGRAHIEHWDGTSWTDETLAEGSIEAIDAFSPKDVWAVGSTGSDQGDPPISEGLLLHYDGTMWSRVPAAPTNRSVGFADVKVIAPDDAWAVGSIVEHWDGTRWSIAYVPPPGQHFNAVDADASDDVWAVGGYFQPFVAHWDGASWAESPAPVVPPGQSPIASVAAVSDMDVWIVGTAAAPPPQKIGHNHAFARRWDGTVWHPAVLPNVLPREGLEGLGLEAVAARGPDDVWLLGSMLRRPVTEHWDGDSWQIIPMRQPLDALSIASGGQLWGAGQVYDPHPHPIVARLCALPPKSADLWVVPPRYDTCCGGNEWRVGKRQTIRFAVWNAGSFPALRSRITIRLPADFRLVTVHSRRASCSVTDPRHPGLVECSLG